MGCIHATRHTGTLFLFSFFAHHHIVPIPIRSSIGYSRTQQVVFVVGRSELGNGFPSPKFSGSGRTTCDERDAPTRESEYYTTREEVRLGQVDGLAGVVASNGCHAVGFM